MSTTALKARPIRRCISKVRPSARPALASRGLRWLVEPGSIPYSAVTQPLPLSLRKSGTFRSQLAVHKTLVLPSSIRAEPGTEDTKPVVIFTGRNSSGLRLSRRIKFLFLYQFVIGAVQTPAGLL